MAKEIRVPALGESVTEATIAKWFRQAGEAVKEDEPLVELETDKVTVEVPAPASGKLSSIDAEPGSTVNVGALLGMIEEGAAGAVPSKPAAAPPKKAEPAPAKAAAVWPLGNEEFEPPKQVSLNDGLPLHFVTSGRSRATNRCPVRARANMVEVAWMFIISSSQATSSFPWSKSSGVTAESTKGSSCRP